MNATVRKAVATDAPVITAFNIAMAFETEGKELDPQRADAGTARLFADPALGFYLVAEDSGEVVASLMVTTEWSDWRNAQFWWIQSVYVRQDRRRQGLFRTLYRALHAMAADDPGVCGFRLYVERDNRNAQSTYRALGMDETHYLVYEELKAGVAWFRRDPGGA
ncbi:MAG: GNAT family N-acetyltransferase [Burkholderiales bacterium]|nr:GNAT family N-acetyltransferase [Burkholderiales bacterium]